MILFDLAWKYPVAHSQHMDQNRIFECQADKCLFVVDIGERIMASVAQNAGIMLAHWEAHHNALYALALLADECFLALSNHSTDVTFNLIEIKNDYENRSSGVRKWTDYVT